MLFRALWRSGFAFASFGAAISSAATVTFETVPAGTRFGQQFGSTPGQVVNELTQDGIQVSFETFSISAQNFTAFVRAETGGAFAPIFPTAPLEMDNINVQFDFTQVGFNVSRVSLEYLELGGLDNFSVNGGTRFEISPLATLPTGVAPGVTLLNEVLDSLTGRSRITLLGDVDSVLIGGQELVVDTIIAVPEPGTLFLFGLCGAFIARGRSRRADRHVRTPDL